MSLAKAGDDATEELWSTHNLNFIPDQDDLKGNFEKARLICRTNYWLKEYFKLKRRMMNAELQINPGLVNGKKRKSTGKSSELDKLNSFLDSPVTEVKTVATDATDKVIGVPGKVFTTQRERIEKFVRDAWNEFMMLDCVIAYWSDSLPYATLLLPEKCRYTDVMGVETLFYTHGLGQTDRKLLPADQAARFEKSEVLIAEVNGDFFKILKTERLGFGLSNPPVEPLFRIAAEIDCLEYGEHAFAYSGTAKFRHHRIGHEIKGSSTMAGKATHFWNKRKAAAIRAIFENKKGFMGDFTSNFDHFIEHPHEPIEYYKADKFDSVEHRLVRWGGPLAAMLIAETDAPFLAQMLRAEGMELRRMMKLFLEPVIADAFDTPVPISLTWSDTVWFETRTMVDAANQGLQAGAISQRTWREKMGYNDEEERNRRIEEGDDAAKNPQYYAPAFDAAHGATDEGGTGSSNGGGRPKTTRDPQGV